MSFKRYLFAMVRILGFKMLMVDLGVLSCLGPSESTFGCDDWSCGYSNGSYQYPQDGSPG